MKDGWNNGSDYEWSKGLRIWLWIVIVGNVLGAISECGNWCELWAQGYQYNSVIGGYLALYVAVDLAVAAGAWILLKKKKKAGFYCMCAGGIGAIILSIFAGEPALAIAPIIGPVVWRFFIRKDWNYLE